MTTFVLIPGGWQGGWAFARVADLLAAHGHHVLPLTLAGLGDEPAPSANLARHIEQVVDVVRAQADDVVLVGHSYGGMVITGAADASPDRVRTLVFCDAYVPDSGDSVWSLTSTRFREAFIAGVAADGLTCAPPPGLDPRCRPQPMGTFLQAIELAGRWHAVPRKVFVAAQGWEESPFIELHRRLHADPQWTTFALDCGHNIAREQPDALVEILLAAV